MHEFIHIFLNPNTVIGAIDIGVIFLIGALIAARMIHLWSIRLSAHPRLFIDKTSADFISQLLRLGVFIFAMTIYAHVIPQLHKLGTALLASASIFSIVFGMAAQSTLVNLIAGIALLFYRPFDIGDQITVVTGNGNERGTVKEVSLGYTKIFTAEGNLVLVPNSLVISSVLVKNEKNKTLASGYK